MKELVPEFMRELTVRLHEHPHGKTWLSAASGLVCVGDRAYVIADDELQLGCFTLKGSSEPDAFVPLTLIRLFAGDLPEDKVQRKKLKPDLEVLVLLPPVAEYPHGALLAMGSGSLAPRCQAVLISLDAAGEPAGAAKIPLDLQALYEPLRSHFDDLNIEGAFVMEGEFHLLQRGNNGTPASARISYPWPPLARWLTGQAALPPPASSIRVFELGSVQGVPLSISDAAALHAGSWVFCAVAENTSDSYHDGACLASTVGLINARGELVQQYRLQGAPKVEGIAVITTNDQGSDEAGNALELLLVTDADDPDIAAQLLRVIYPLPESRG